MDSAGDHSLVIRPSFARSVSSVTRLRLVSARRLRLSMPMRAFLGSRALVVAAGAAGYLLPRGSGWINFDPSRVSSRLGHLGNFLGASSVRWDSLWYLAIANHGYSSKASAGFFPVYPLLMRGLSYVTGSTLVAGVVISWVAFAVSLVLLHRLTELELGRSAADTAVLLLALAPLSFFFTAVYTESLFLALALGATYAARRDKWLLAGMLGTLAAVTRITGVLLVVMVLLGCVWRRARPQIDRRRLWLLAAPLAFIVYLVGLAISGYGFLAPFTAQASSIHDHSFAGPFVAIIQAFGAAARGLGALAGGSQPLISFGSLAAPLSPGAESVYLLGVLLVSVGALALCFRRLPRAYGVFALLAFLVAISSPVAGQPLKSLDRYVLTIFPLWMVAGAWLAERRRQWPALAACACLLAFFTVQFATWTFVA